MSTTKKKTEETVETVETVRPPEPSSKADWLNLAWHRNVTMPSGMRVELRIPGVTELIRDAGLPDNLRGVVLRAATHPEGLLAVLRDDYAKIEANAEASLETRQQALADSVQTLAELQIRLCVSNVRLASGETLSREDLEGDGIPEPDKEWLGLIMLRQIDQDARGVRLGVEPLDSWERFRHHHDCASDCGACASLQFEFSSAYAGLGAL